MSFLSGLGHILKSGVGVLGDVSKFAAPIAGMIPGVGTLAAAGLGGIGSLESDFGHGRSLNLGNALKSGAMGALGGMAGGALRGGGGLSGIGGKLGSIFGGGGGGLGGLFGGGGQGGQQGRGQGGLGVLGTLGSLGLAGMNTYQGAQQQEKADKLRQQIIAQTQSQQGDRDIARKKLMGQLGNVPQRPNLGSLFAAQSSNPFSRPGM